MSENERWVLKVLNIDSCFVGSDNSNLPFNLVFKMEQAKSFESNTAAEAFARAIESDPELVSKKLVAIRTGTDSFIIGFWARFFQCLGKISWFYWAQKIGYPSTYRCVEVWALTWSFLALISLFIADKHWIVAWGAAILGGVRVFETVVYQINVTFFDEYRALKERLRDPAKPHYAVRGFRRLVVLSIHNYFEILVWFAVFYSLAHASFGSNVATSACSGLADSGCALYFSVVTMFTVGYGDVTAIDGLGRFLTSAQIIIGAFLAIIVFARVISLIPKPISLDELEQ